MTSATPSSSPASPVPTSTRLAYVDGLRGVAVLMVVCFHAVLWGGFPVEGRVPHFLQVGGWTVPFELGLLRHLFSVGGGGVDLFLVISGFCLFLPLLRRGETRTQPLDMWRFLQRRTRRIVPPFYAGLALVLGISWLTSQFEGPSWWPWAPNSFQNAFPFVGLDAWYNLISHLTLTHGLFHRYQTAYEGSFWSLSLEWQFYFLFLILGLIGSRVGVLAAVVFPIVATVVFRGLCFVFAPDFLNTSVGFDFCLARWAEFGAGMIAAAIVSRSLPAAFFQALRPLKPFLSLIVVALLALAWRIEFFDPSSVLRIWAWGAAGAALLACSASLPLLARILGWKPLVALGTISYSLYLAHGAVYMGMALILSRTEISRDARQLLFFLGGPAIAIACSIVFFWIFERPFLKKKSAPSEHAAP
ncbi:acyltransferase [bacterium]|nr:MAG: acyltransferase [bacterium]